MPKTPPIDELREICQSAKSDSGYAKHINRIISIYITKLLLYTPITANQVTILWILLGVAAGILFSFGNYWYSIIAALLINLSEELDYVDGEIARYRKACSPFGQYLDHLGHMVVYPTLFIGIAYGVYNNFHNPVIFLFGCLAILFFSFLPLNRLFNLSRILQAHREEDALNTKSVVKQPQPNEIKIPKLLRKIAVIISVASSGSVVFLWLLLAAALNYTQHFLIIFGILLPYHWFLLRLPIVLTRNLTRK